MVTARRGHTLVVRPISSRPQRFAHPGYRPIERWVEAGLGRRSAVRLLDLPIPLSDVIFVVGSLHPDDLGAAFPFWARQATARARTEPAPPTATAAGF